jgi:PAS domain-containing protein
MNVTAMQRKSSGTVAPTGSGNRAVAVSAWEDMAVLTLDGRGMICDCNRAGENLFEYHRNALVWRAISMLLPELAGLALMESGQPNARLRFLCRIGHQFQAVTQNGERFAGALCLNLLDSAGYGRLSLIVCPNGNSSAQRSGAV